MSKVIQNQKCEEAAHIPISILGEEIPRKKGKYSVTSSCVDLTFCGPISRPTILSAIVSICTFHSRYGSYKSWLVDI